MPLTRDFPQVPLSLGEERLPPMVAAALLLDCDGTLLDIAPTPDSVVVPAGLAAALLALRDVLGGAVAIVTGRPVAQIDALFPNIPTAVAGEHGASLRHTIDGPIEHADLPAAPAGWLARAAALVEAHPGTVLEPKERGFVLHYRLAPEAGATLHDAMQVLVATDARFSMLPALMAWEVRPRAVDKGTAVRALMARPPFAGRLPVFLGDDLTDEDGMRAARALGGAGLFVPRVFGNAAGVRRWLEAAAGGA